MVTVLRVAVGPCSTLVCLQQCPSAAVSQRSLLLTHRRFSSPLSASRHSPIRYSVLSKRRSQSIRVSSDASSNAGAVTSDAPAQLNADDELDEKDIQDILSVLDLLKEKRDMPFNEVRLTIMIEDPREVERRRQLGIEADIGCSREDLADALVEVTEGIVPQDRVVLRQLAEEMRNWPNLEDEEAVSTKAQAAVSPYAKLTDTGVDPQTAALRANLPDASTTWDDAAADLPLAEESKDLSQMVPSWVGYGFLYGLSIVPILIGVAVVLILFLNSLQ